MTSLTQEQNEILWTFFQLLEGPTSDGGRKRAAGSKKVWTDDDSHMQAMYRHLERWEEGQRADADSGSHPLVHVAWRALAIAWQEKQLGWRYSPEWPFKPPTREGLDNG